MTPAQPKKFEDTTLVQHPEVKKAYEFYLEAKKQGDPTAEIVEEIGLDAATLISALTVNKNPHLVAAVVLLPFALNHDGDQQKIDKLQQSFEPLTLEYAEAVSIMMHPFGIAEVFPTLPKSHRDAAITVSVVMSLQELKHLETSAPQMSKSELRRELRNDGDGTMPGFEQLVAYADLRSSEPQLMAAYDSLKQSLLDTANGRPAQPSAPKGAPRP